MIQGSDIAILRDWQNFYMLTGTAAATLAGLMFVVATLLAGSASQRATLNAGTSAFTSPTMAHFGAVLALAGILSAPWQAFSSAGRVLDLLGLALSVYLMFVLRRMRRVPDYQTPWKDWVWYLVLPLSAYSVLLAAALTLPANPAPALYLIGAVMVALLFLGIHNAWDLVTFLAIERSHSNKGA